MPEPNHVCKNCGKEYYCCRSCDKINSWKAVGCSIECFTAYTSSVVQIRANELKKEIEEKSLAELKELDKQELAKEIEENPESTISQIVDEINKTNSKNYVKKSKNKRKYYIC
jgi:hypothetical protein